MKARLMIFLFVLAFGSQFASAQLTMTDAQKETYEKRMKEMVLKHKARKILTENSSYQEATDCFVAEKIFGNRQSAVVDLMAIKAHAENTVTWHAVRETLAEQAELEITAVTPDNFCDHVSMDCEDQNAMHRVHKTCRNRIKKAEKRAAKKEKAE